MTSSLNIVHVVLSLDCGGLERGVLNLVRQAPSLGQRVTVLCLERPGILAEQVEHYGARVACVFKRPGIRPGVIPRIRRLLQELRPDVMHTHQITALFYAGLAARQLKVPVTVHSEKGKHYSGLPRKRWLGRWAGCYADRVFCVSKDIAMEVVTQRIVPGRKVRVIPNGIDTSDFRRRGDTETLRAALGIPRTACVIGTVGRLHEIKRYDLLVRAFAELKSSVPDAHLVLVGDGPEMSPLRRLAEGLGLTRCVHLVGYQEQPQPYLSLMTVFALTSRSEGMPQAILEAWAAGIPVVASRVGGVPELIEHERSGLLFESGDEAALAEGLRRAVLDRNLARSMCQVGQHRVEARHSLPRQAGAYHDQYLELLAASCKRISRLRRGPWFGRLSADEVLRTS